MNREYAARVLADYRANVELARTQKWLSKERRATMQAVNELLPHVNAVLHELLPDIAPIDAYSLNDHVRTLQRVERAERLLVTWKAITVVGPGGAEVAPPYLPFVAMDPIVSSAASLWEKGKYRQAVNDAAGKLNELTQKRLGRKDIADTRLMAMAFNPKGPEKGRPRLRCPGDPNTDTVKSMQEGVHLMAMGCMLAIRNPATHETGDGNPITCAEQLGTLSTVARWVRNWILERYVEPIDTEQISPAMQKALAQWQQVQLPQQQRAAPCPQPAQTDGQRAD